MANAQFRVVQPPATGSDLAALRDACGELPSSYLEFLGKSNGAEWCINDQGGDCLAFWSAHEIPELNEAYQIARWVPELFGDWLRWWW